MTIFTDPHSGDRKFFKGTGKRSYKKYNDDPLPKDPVKRKRVLDAWSKSDSKKLDNLPLAQSEKEKKQAIAEQRKEINRIRRLERLAQRKKKK